MTLILMLKEMIRHAGSSGTKVSRMAHRGRQNVLVNVLGKTVKTFLRVRR